MDYVYFTIIISQQFQYTKRFMQRARLKFSRLNTNCCLYKQQTSHAQSSEYRNLKSPQFPMLITNHTHHWIHETCVCKHFQPKSYIWNVWQQWKIGNSNSVVKTEPKQFDIRLSISSHSLSCDRYSRYLQVNMTWHNKKQLSSFFFSFTWKQFSINFSHYSYFWIFTSCVFCFLSLVSFAVLCVTLCTIATAIGFPAEPQNCLSLRLSLTCHPTLLFAFSLIGVTAVADAPWFPESEQSCSG